MTIVYHGCQEPFKPANQTSKRYGLVVLFFSTQLRLAKNFANGTDNIYKLELKADVEIDFNGEVAHSAKYRNLIYKLSREGHDVVAITNVYDSPNSSYPLEKSTIFVVFEINRIKNITKCT